MELRKVQNKKSKEEIQKEQAEIKRVLEDNNKKIVMKAAERERQKDYEQHLARLGIDKINFEGEF